MLEKEKKLLKAFLRLPLPPPKVDADDTDDDGRVGILKSSATRWHSEAKKLWGGGQAPPPPGHF